MKQRTIILAPDWTQMDAWKITYPPTESRRREWVIEPMRFIPHDGKAKG
jgi:hypothetical protein